MANFKVPNLCGASPEFNSILSKFEITMDSALDGLEDKASELKSKLNTDVTALVGDIKLMIPELPKLPDINLQAQLTSLSGLAVGSGAHNTLLAGITSKFGSALTAGGFSLDGLVSDAASAISGGTNLCSAVPNFTVPAAGGEAVQKAVAVLQPKVDSIKEEASTLVENTNLTAAVAAAKSKVSKMQTEGDSTDADVVKGTVTSKENPTSDTGSYTVATKSKQVAFSASGGSSKVKVTTAKDQAGKNVAPADSGFVRRPQKQFELIQEKIITNTSDGHTFELFRTPIEVTLIRGFSYTKQPEDHEGKIPWITSIFSGDKLRAHKSGKDLRQQAWSMGFGLWYLRGKKVIVHVNELKFSTHPGTNKKGEASANYAMLKDVMFVCNYTYLESYDPNFIDTDEA